MARRISTGIVGKNVLGALSTTENTLTSVIEDDDIIFDPSGQGEVLAESNVFIQDQKLLKLGDSDSSNWVGLRAPGTVSANVTLTFPSTAGTSGYVLTTDGSGNLTWDNVAVQLGDDVSSDTGTYYPLITSSTSGGITQVKIVTSRLSFIPQSGTLEATILKTSNADLNGGNIDGTAIGSSVASTGRFTTITETSSIAYKENVTPIEDALDKIVQLVGVTYDRKDGSRKNEAGLIKEDVEKIIPNVVLGDGINYTKLTAYLIEAVKSLKQELDSLKNR